MAQKYCLEYGVLSHEEVLVPLSLIPLSLIGSRVDAEVEVTPPPNN